ncbi:Probable GMP synthase [glutamine-hydrolyzing] (GMP synthetase) (Glutamine amidotransferase) [Durusdinium trenchii]|uniref:Probable GMP synthase [glutamine-hydrolyzing] (GMP synthetase) (Glutamine amidotransferase) n=1 Tax=Durusdinium trenchii TaxID=1381693 RepID=A0ABP0S921_9DINO
MPRSRGSTSADQEALFEVWRSAVEATHDFLQAEDCAAISEQVRSYVATSHFQVVEEEDFAQISTVSSKRPVAFLGATKNKIDSLFVHADYMGQGIGKALLWQTIVSLFDEFGEVYVDVNEQNEQAHRFYLSQGFKQEICIVLEMPRAAFIAALEDHPEEQEHFQKIGRQHGVVVASTQWPLFEGASQKLLSLINLYARKHITAKGHWSTFNGEQLPEHAAILVLRGEIRMVTPDKGELVFTEGTCFNEQLLFGLPPLDGRLHPQGNCEVQIMTADIFDRVVAECPHERDFIMQRIVNEIARKAEQHMGFGRGDPGGALVLSTVIQVAADDFADQLRRRIDARIYEPGAVITEAGQEGNCMFVLVDGEAENEGDGLCHGKALPLKVGSVFGVPWQVDLVGTYPNRTRALTRCIALALTQEVFHQVLEEFPSHVELYNHMAMQGHQTEVGASELNVQLGKSRAFSNVSKDFLMVVCERADEVYFGPGDDIFRRGEACKLGEALMYILLQGAAIVEGEYGDELGRLNSGDVVGEGGALGIAPIRGATVRAWRDSLVRAVRLHGSSVQRAVTAFPDEYESLQQIFQKRASANKEVERVRQKWLQEQVIPALNTCRIFQGFPEPIIRKIAEHLLQATYTCALVRVDQNLWEEGDRAMSRCAGSSKRGPSEPRWVESKRGRHGSSRWSWPFLLGWMMWMGKTPVV